ncbi:MAG: M23 family metallopeptidase [Acidimicrobiia bacterium]|nr:M23 family metallopeptidase [Acidimicrobiia bacterium]
MCHAILAVMLLWSGASVQPSTACAGLAPPVPGRIVSAYEPSGLYAGHWGVDLDAAIADPVRAAATGTVTFAGLVAGNRTVTVDHGGGLKTSYSYLSGTRVGRGARVRAGQVIGLAGTPHDTPGVHFSVRLNRRYVDPEPWFDCRPLDVSRGLRLVR